jgi:UDPglucose--hexose-1-phosphate uridylyltransferase
MSVIRLDGQDPARLVDLADRILTAWRGYSDPEAGVLAFTDGTPHNTITPIARMRGEEFELDLVLRNNRTTEEYPLGIFHPHQELHHIKKENIGLIEVMGLAVLPARLLGEMDVLAQRIMGGMDLRGDEQTAAHADWAEDFLKQYPEYAPEHLAFVTSGEERAQLRADLDRIIEKEIGLVFSRVLEHCAVFADNEQGAVQFEQFVRVV